MKIAHEDIEKMAKITDKKVVELEKKIYRNREKKYCIAKCVLFFAPVLLACFLAYYYSFSNVVIFVFIALAVASLHIYSDISRKQAVNEILRRMDEEEAARHKHHHKET